MDPKSQEPPVHPNCRCSTSAYMSREELEKELFGEDEDEEPAEIIDDIGLAKAGISKANGVFVNNAEQLARFARRIPSEDGFDDFTIHCDGLNFYIDMVGNGKAKDFVKISVDDLAKHIKDSKEFTGGPIRIISCQAGKYDDGPAKQLATKLGVAVKAPTEDIHVDEKGEIFISDNDTLAEMWYSDKKDRGLYRQTGSWRILEP